MRRIPGREIASSIVMAHHRNARAVTRPIVTGAVLTGGKRPAIQLSPREDVVLVRHIADALDRLALFAQRGEAVQGITFAGQVERVPMEVREILRDSRSSR